MQQTQNMPENVHTEIIRNRSTISGNTTPGWLTEDGIRCRCHRHRVVRASAASVGGQSQRRRSAQEQQGSATLCHASPKASMYADNELWWWKGSENWTHTHTKSRACSLQYAVPAHKNKQDDTRSITNNVYVPRV